MLTEELIDLFLALHVGSKLRDWYPYVCLLGFNSFLLVRIMWIIAKLVHEGLRLHDVTHGWHSRSRRTHLDLLVGDILP